MLLSDNSLGLKFYPFKKDFLGVGVRGDDGEGGWGWKYNKNIVILARHWTYLGEGNAVSK